MTDSITIQEFDSVNGTAKRAGISRSYVYILNKKYGFIKKLGSKSLIYWPDFKAALMNELKPLN